MTKQKKRTFKAPAHLTQHRAAARRSAPPHDDPSPTGRAPRHGAGIRPPEEGRHVPSAHIRARLAPAVLYRSSFVVVVSGQWCTHCDTRDNRRLVAIKTAFARLTKAWRTPRAISARRRNRLIVPYLFPKFGWRSGVLRTSWRASPVVVFCGTNRLFSWHSWTRHSPRRPPIMTKPNGHYRGLMRGPRRHRSRRERTRTHGHHIRAISEPGWVARNKVPTTEVWLRSAGWGRSFLSAVESR